LPAEPIIGYPKLYTYFDEELKYPENLQSDSINGVITASFVINTEGNPEQITIINSLGPAFDEEVKRLIVGMPKWKPATLNGKPVTSKVSIPFTFTISRKKNSQ